jgi:hypothetical protein
VISSILGLVRKRAFEPKAHRVSWIMKNGDVNSVKCFNRSEATTLYKSILNNPMCSYVELTKIIEGTSIYSRLNAYSN